MSAGSPVDGAVVAMCSALGDEMRWSILSALGEGEASASALARRLPVTRQAIAKHLAVLEEVGLVETVRCGREVRYRVIGSRLSATARRLDAIGAAWDRRLADIKRIAAVTAQPASTRRASACSAGPLSCAILSCARCSAADAAPGGTRAGFSARELAQAATSGWAVNARTDRSP